MNKRPVHSDSHTGFTLVELLLVLVLVAVSVAVVVPCLRGTLSGWQLRETARNVQATLQLASQWATTRQETVVFALDARKGVFTVQPLPQEDTQLTPSAVPVIGRQSLGRNVRAVRTSGLQDAGQEKTLVFRPDGLSDTAEIVLTDAGAGRAPETVWRIAIDRRGTVQCREGLADDKSR